MPSLKPGNIEVDRCKNLVEISEKALAASGYIHNNPRFKLKQIQILKNKIWDFIIKFEFPEFSLLGVKIGVF